MLEEPVRILPRATRFLCGWDTRLCGWAGAMDARDGSGQRVPAAARMSHSSGMGLQLRDDRRNYCARRHSSWAGICAQAGAGYLWLALTFFGLLSSERDNMNSRSESLLR
jgi:hypothetical protein